MSIHDAPTENRAVIDRVENRQQLNRIKSAARSIGRSIAWLPRVGDAGYPAPSDHAVWSLPQASHFWRAWLRLMKQCASKHAARNLPLNDSIKALSVCLPGREKSMVTPR
jgi:hypothetical protein